MFAPPNNNSDTMPTKLSVTVRGFRTIFVYSIITYYYFVMEDCWFLSSLRANFYFSYYLYSSTSMFICAHMHWSSHFLHWLLQLCAQLAIIIWSCVVFVVNLVKHTNAAGQTKTKLASSWVLIFPFFFISTTHETVVCRVLVQLLLFVFV